MIILIYFHILFKGISSSKFFDTNNPKYHKADPATVNSESLFGFQIEFSSKRNM